MDTNIVYEFDINERTLPDYKITHSLLTWLQNNLSNLVDDDNNKIFNRVNIGYNEKSLKGFGSKPVCDVYLNKINYRTDFDLNIPSTVDTIMIITLKGNANNTYGKALQLTDYIIQEFIENNNWRELETIVKETNITNTRVEINPNNKVWSTLIVFELNHVLI